MGRSLFSIGGLYITTNSADIVNGNWGQSSKKGIGATWGISDDKPDRIQGMALSPGLIRATTVSGKFEIMFSEIDSIDTCDIKAKGKKSAVQIKMKNGAIHIIDVKNPSKADHAAAILLQHLNSVKS